MGLNTWWVISTLNNESQCLVDRFSDLKSNTKI